MIRTSKNSGVDEGEPVPTVLPIEEPWDNGEPQPNDNTKRDDEVRPLRTV